MTFEFTVFGEPQAKGSMKAFLPKGWNRPIVTSTNRNLKAWEQLLRQRANEVRREHGAEPIAGPVIIEARFYFARPKKLMTRRAALMNYPMVSTPDLDKLCRSLDGLNGILFIDDKQVIKLNATKEYAKPGEGSSCYVRVEEYIAGGLFERMGAAAHG